MVKAQAAQAELASDHAELDALMGVSPGEADGSEELDALMAADLADGEGRVANEGSEVESNDAERTDEQLLEEMTDEDVVYTVACDALEAGAKYTTAGLVKSLVCVEVDDARLALCLMVLRDRKPFSGNRVLQLLEADPRLRDVAAEARSTVAMEEQAKLGEAEVAGAEVFDEDPTEAVLAQDEGLQSEAGADDSDSAPAAAEGSQA